MRILTLYLLIYLGFSYTAESSEHKIRELVLEDEPTLPLSPVPLNQADGQSSELESRRVRSNGMDGDELEEFFGLVQQEAVSEQIAVVSSPINSIPEIIVMIPVAAGAA